ncbi:MAG: hypothetical protein PHI50_03280 [Alphaproteobacteria bacterium]|nr:hypothetical protein [Alphaproteobacteria bacterium]
MAFINSLFQTDFELPNGEKVSSLKEAEEKMNQLGITLSSNYSEDYYKKKHLSNTKKEKEDLFNLFILNYKRSIWL